MTLSQSADTTCHLLHNFVFRDQIRVGVWSFPFFILRLKSITTSCLQKTSAISSLCIRLFSPLAQRNALAEKPHKHGHWGRTNLDVVQQHMRLACDRPDQGSNVGDRPLTCILRKDVDRKNFFVDLRRELNLC